MEIKNVSDIVANPISPTTTILLLIVIVTFCAWSAPQLLNALALKSRLTRRTQVLHRITYAFIHRDFTHVALNMDTIWSVGRGLEAMLDSTAFAAIYFFGVLTPAILAYYTSLLDRFSMVVGASAGTFAMIGACAALKPNANLLLFFVMPVILGIGVIGVLIFSIVKSLSPTSTIWHFGHVVGLVVGASVAWLPKTEVSK